jgi:hypothetical protein
VSDEDIRAIANAVLYEGYLLYPYRHSAIKNRQRWTIGIVYPRAFSEAQSGADPWMAQTECLVLATADATLDVTVRFLHLLTRSVVDSRQRGPTEGRRGAIGWMPDSWDEGMEREVAVSGLTLADLATSPWRAPFAFPAAHLVERPENIPMTQIVRDQRPLEGVCVIGAQLLDGGVYKVGARVENTTSLAGAIPDRHVAALSSSFVSTHVILRMQGGAFVSLLDPPDELRAAASGCRNQGFYPVLVGAESAHDTMLASPIILYDYPQIAPESSGALFDGTEIDEILTLRILALSDDEKEEMRQGDVHAREILERTESLTAEQLMKLHGVIRSLGPMDKRGAV